MTVRPYIAADTPAIADLYRDSVRVLGPQRYTPGQIEAWSTYANDVDGLQTTLGFGHTLVSEEDGRIAAFGELLPWDNVALLYCAPQFARRGHATAIYEKLEAVARRRGVTRLTTTASHLSKPLFEKKGFTLTEVELSHFGGAEFERFKMEKRLS
jgi:putative acetyltransferase